MVVLPTGGVSLTDEVWAGDIDGDVEGNHTPGLANSSVFGHGTGHVESCGVQKIPGRVQSRLCRSECGVSWREISWLMMWRRTSGKRMRRYGRGG